MEEGTAPNALLAVQGFGALEQSLEIPSPLPPLQLQPVGDHGDELGLVGLPLELLTVKPKYFCRVSRSPRSQATSMAWRMARSTRDAVVPNFRATSG